MSTFPPKKNKGIFVLTLFVLFVFFQRACSGRIGEDRLYDEAESLYSKDTEERQQFVEKLQVLANTGSQSCSTLLCGSATTLRFQFGR